MRPLVAVRHARPFDPLWFERTPLFRPVARAARAFAAFDDFPPLDAFANVFSGAPPVRFVPAARRRRDRSGPIDPGALYDGRIALAREVPTRPRCWHDLMNAVVWGTFPRAKLALHTRQHRAIAARVTPEARTLPPMRTRELDALALLDEGGIVVLARQAETLGAALRTEGSPALARSVRSGDAVAFVFGHAVYESLVLGVRPAAVAAIVLDSATRAPVTVAEADAALARAIESPSRLVTPEELRRVDVNDAVPASIEPHDPARI